MSVESNIPSEVKKAAARWLSTKLPTRETSQAAMAQYPPEAIEQLDRLYSQVQQGRERTAQRLNSPGESTTVFRRPPGRG